jgi:hypothetical protein
MAYTGWLGVKGHERARPYDPEDTRALNAEIERREKPKPKTPPKPEKK